MRKAKIKRQPSRCASALDKQAGLTHIAHEKSEKMKLSTRCGRCKASGGLSVGVAVKQKGRGDPRPLTDIQYQLQQSLQPLLQPLLQQQLLLLQGLQQPLQPQP